MTAGIPPATASLASLQAERERLNAANARSDLEAALEEAAESVLEAISDAMRRRNATPTEA